LITGKDERDLLSDEGTEFSVEIIDVVRIEASEAELFEDGKEVADRTNGQEGEGVGSLAEVGAASGAEKKGGLHPEKWDTLMLEPLSDEEVVFGGFIGGVRQPSVEVKDRSNEGRASCPRLTP
jgi:hypothetical protein